MTTRQDLAGRRTRMLDSIQRIAAGGSMDGAVERSPTDGLFTLSPDYLLLVRAGREPTTESTFVDVWMSCDPELLRAWIASEVRRLER
jgi:hypothetical protein